jgi:predicted ATPase with chaperone activity
MSKAAREKLASEPKPPLTAAEKTRLLAPKPTGIADTGLSQWLLADLACKQLAESGVLDLGEIAQRMALPGTVVEELFHFLRSEGRVELSSRRDNSPLLRFNLTERGRATAAEASQRDGYVGPAPVTLEQYEQLIGAQSARHFPLTRQQTEELFADTVIDPALIGRLGPAIHSGRAIFIYGQSGTGKSFIARRLKRALGPAILLPHAIAVGDSIIRYFDPSVHTPITQDPSTQPTPLQQGIDARFILCERPMVVAAGELTMDVLDLQYNPAKRLYAAPLQLKANGGLLIIDDLGRQRIPPETLLNRWILPMEEKHDQLSLNSGQHFSVPFDLTLVFSTNLEPGDLADEAFLRRIGYKVRFEESTPEEYRAIWQQNCAQNDIEFDSELLTFVIEELYTEQRTPLLPCHPRDLLQLAMDFTTYMDGGDIDRKALRWAWQNYFLEV